MFTTMHSFLFFFIPTTILFILGIIFEDKLIELEDSLKNAIRKSLRKKPKQRQVKQSSPKKQDPVAKANTAQKRRVNKAA